MNLEGSREASTERLRDFPVLHSEAYLQLAVAGAVTSPECSLT